MTENYQIHLSTFATWAAYLQIKYERYKEVSTIVLFQATVLLKRSIFIASIRKTGFLIM